MSSLPFTTRPELVGSFGAVSSTHWIASAVGMRMLEAGGNAFDAAVAAGFALQIVEPHLNGPAGEVPVLACRSADPAPTVICGQGGAPARASIAAFRGLGLDLIPGVGLLPACVPGAFGAWLTLLRDWGTCSLRACLEPAIFYASEGHPILAGAVAAIGSVQDIFRTQWPSSAAVFLPGGSPPRAGSNFRNQALGALYARIVAHAERSAAAREAQIEAALAFWYEGFVADAIDRFVENGSSTGAGEPPARGFLRGADLAGWRPAIEKPVSVHYKDCEIFKCGAWSQGPSLLQALRIVEARSIDRCDPLSADFVHLAAEALKLSLADRDAWYGDAGDVPLQALLGRDYARARADLITAAASAEFRAGSPSSRAPWQPPLRSAGSTRVSELASGGEPTFAEPRAAQARAVGGDTCHVDTVDRWGNLVSATPSGGWLQSSPVIPALGFALGTRLQMCWLEPGLPNSLTPGRRPRTTLTPSMAFRNARPYLAFGTPGGDQQEQWSLQFFLRHVDHAMPIQQAIDAPSFRTNHVVNSFWPREIEPGSLVLEDRFPVETIRELSRRGHRVSVGGSWSEGRISACGYERDGNAVRVHAAANARGMQGYAVAR